MQPEWQEGTANAFICAHCGFIHSFVTH
jgi:hypothetical protein